MIRRRADALPEGSFYPDDGCSESPSCLECPLPMCRYEYPGGLRSLMNIARDQKIVGLRTLGAPVAVIADEIGVSRRTVFRILQLNQREEVAA